MLISLKSLIVSQPFGDGAAINAILSSFSCKKDNDLKFFLRRKAIGFEILMRSRTYLIFDTKIMQDSGELKLLGYFTISLKVLDIPEGLDADEIVRLDGKYAEFHGEPIKSLPCYLIGQLGRSDCASHDELNGSEILEEALRVIRQSHDAVGGRIILIECKENKKLVDFYKDNGFELFRIDASGQHKMMQMIYRLDNEA